MCLFYCIWAKMQSIIKSYFNFILFLWRHCVNFHINQKLLLMQTILCFKIPLHKPSDHMKYAKMDYWNALYVNFGAWLKSIVAIYLKYCIFWYCKMQWICKTVSNKNIELQNLCGQLLILIASFTFNNLVLLNNMPKAINECHFCCYVAYFLCDSLLIIYSFFILLEILHFSAVVIFRRKKWQNIIIDVHIYSLFV